MEELILLDELTSASVSVVTKKYIVIDGTRYFIGDPHRAAYVNSIRGRTEISENLPEPYLSSVMALWGDTPIVPEPEIENKNISEN